ncbi:MAG TPA: hypothetical protein VFB89_06670, partial [Gemmatimonadales bacterium]|nr:hypothetical protein [Gemmatimonadales bacterium]
RLAEGRQWQACSIRVDDKDEALDLYVNKLAPEAGQIAQCFCPVGCRLASWAGLLQWQGE